MEALMSNKLIDDLYEASPNRRRFLRTLGAATVVAGIGSTSAVRAEAQAPSETDILNFALNLEYLEAEFYTFAVTGGSISRFGIKIDGHATGSNPRQGGATAGGSKVNFPTDERAVADLAEEIGVDERAHVSLIRGALGAAAVAKPNLNLNALGFGFGNLNDFLKASRMLEDIGVTAYTGAAGLLKTPGVITTAGRLLAAEAEHVGAIRMQVARLKIASSPMDAADMIPPPTGKASQLLSISGSNGLPSTRTAGQVLFLALGGKAGVSQGGFFPTGLNGNIRDSSEAATAKNWA
jgi:hypothetical protein